MTKNVATQAKTGRIDGVQRVHFKRVTPRCKEWFRQLAVAYLVATPVVALLLVHWVPHQMLGCMFILHGLVLVPTFIPNGGWFGPIVRRFETQEKEVFLTLDDGPDPELTPRVLELLAVHDAKACFFVIGRKVREAPGLARAIVERGHELGNHTDSHRPRWFWSCLWRGVAREVEGCSRSIRDAAGVVPRWFRSPVGFSSPFVFPVIRAANLRLLGWSAWAKDCGEDAPETAAARVLKAVRPGAIIVIHPECKGADGTAPGFKCLELVLCELSRQGYRCVLPPGNSGEP